MTVPLVALSKVALINPKGPKSGEIDPDDTVDFVPMAAVSETGSMSVAAARPYSEVAKGYTAFKSGDVLMAKITPCYENNKIALAEVTTEYAFGSTEFHVIRVDEGKPFPPYLTHFLRQDSIRSEGEKRMTGSGGQRRVPKDFLETLAIPLPPLEEQRWIAAVLDQADALRRLRTQALTRLNALGQAIFHEMFGDLVANSKGFHPVSVGEVIEGFETGKNLAEDPDGGLPGAVRVLKISAVTSGTFKPSESKALPPDYEPPASHYVRAGDVLFSRANTEELIGATAFVDQAPHNLVLPDKLWRFVWRDPSPVLPRFILALFTSRPVRDEISKRATGTSGSMKNIGQQKVLQIPFGLPPLELQREFVRRTEEVGSQIRSSSTALAASETLFTALQHRAFRGEL